MTPALPVIRTLHPFFEEFLMKRALFLASLFVTSSVFAQDIVLNYAQNRNDMFTLLLDVSFYCDTTSGKKVILEGGMIKEDEKLIFDFADRFILVNHDNLKPLTIRHNNNEITLNGLGGEAHIDYPNELNLKIVRNANGGAKITGTIDLNYTSEKKKIGWNCKRYVGDLKP